MWSASLIAEVAATGAIDVIDFKDRCGIEVEDEAALLAMCREVVVRLPDAILEDSHDLPEAAELLEPAPGARLVAAPIAAPADITTRGAAAEARWSQAPACRGSAGASEDPARSDLR